MVIGVSVILSCLLYSSVLTILYFSKTRLKTTDNKVYSILVIINIFGLLLELACCYFTYMNETTVFNTFMCYFCNRLFIIYMLTWLTVFTFYIFSITHKQKNSNNENKKKRYTKIAIIIYIFFLILATLLPLECFSDGKYVYSYGPATNLLVVFGGVTILLDILWVIKNRKSINRKQSLPLFILILLMVVVLIIRNINPGIILINSTFAFITFIMYFTIENPDVQMIEELYKNKKLIEKSNEDTSKFIFRMTQDIKKPVKDIISISHGMTSMNDIEGLLSAGKYINNYANQIDYLMNKALNISNMDTQKIKVFDTRYNVENLFKEITFRAKEDIKENIKFDFNISSNIPTYLYGDTIKLKQVISSVINIANDFTTEGFISLDVSSIIRYNMCRLIITIEDSGKGIGIDRINQILSFNSDDLKNIDTDNKDDRKLDILSVKKLINMLGGSLMIKSEPNIGTTVTIILEQKVVETKETEISKKLENYEQSLYGEKQVLVVDDDEKELEKIEKQISSDGIMVSSTVYGRDAIEKIRSKLKYDLIILDDDLGQSSALSVLQELQKEKNFKTPVVVMINDNKEKIKLHYLQDGFADTISKSKLETEIDRIMKRF